MRLCVDSRKFCVELAAPELVASPSLNWQLFIRELKVIPQHAASRIQTAIELSILWNIGERFSRMLTFVQYGTSFAIVVPGDLMSKVDRMENFLYSTLNKMGFKYDSKLEVFEI